MIDPNNNRGDTLLAKQTSATLMYSWKTLLANFKIIMIKEHNTLLFQIYLQIKVETEYWQVLLQIPFFIV